MSRDPRGTRSRSGSRIDDLGGGRYLPIPPTAPCARHRVRRPCDYPAALGLDRWIAEQSGEQTLILAFDTPQTIRKILVEIDEPEISRTQEMAVSISRDGGQTYRELIRQEYNFSPPGTTLGHEEWTITADAISHLQLRIKP